MHPADELAAYLAANPKPDFSVVDCLWSKIESHEDHERDNAKAA